MAKRRSAGAVLEELFAADEALVTADYNKLAALTSSAAELNALDGITATVAELNALDGITATVAELNALDGITASVAELNIMDGVTADAAEISLLAGAGAAVASGTQDAAIADIAITYSTNDPSITPDGAVTVADGSSATVAELLELVEELIAKQNLIIDALEAFGVLAAA